MTATTEPEIPSLVSPPAPVPADAGVPLPPDPLGYRVKRKLLGPPLHSDEMEHQRLGKPTALAVFASDNLSSSAYATEEILHVLVPIVGLAAFSLVVPITLAMVVVLGFLILSYRETIKEYPSAGGAYLVTARQLRHRPGPGRGGIAPHRLHPHRGGVGGRRHRRARVGLRGLGAVQGADRVLLHRASWPSATCGG